MQFYKCRDVKSPQRGTELSAGIDFFVPTDLTEKILAEKNPVFSRFRLMNGIIRLNGHSSLLIPSGLHVHFEKGFVLKLCNKSGIASKRGLDSVADIIDADYQGEFHFHVVNTTNLTQDIVMGEKLLQGILLPVSLEHTKEITTLEELYPEETERGDGGFGSTGK